jgi:hypothetical protein
MKSGCACAAHRGRRYRRTDGHLLRWEGTQRLVAVSDGHGKVISPWAVDGEGPITMECPCCGELNEVGPEGMTHGLTH